MVSCNLPIRPGFDQETQEIPLKYSTVSAMLTKTAQAEGDAVSEVTAIVTPVVVMTMPPNIMVTISPSSTVVERTTPSINNGPENSCDVAQAGKPIDITIPDDSQLYPGEFFSKTWRLINSGTCLWTQNYAVVWFSGDNLGIKPIQTFSKDVPSGSFVDVTVDMIAPLAPGTYQSNWKLRNLQGNLFGIGPQGDAPFWVRIVVIPVETTTPTPMLSVPTPTPAIFASGTLELQFNQKADLDSGLVDQPLGNDIVWQKNADDNVEVKPENGARIIVYGDIVPEINDCLQASMSEVPVGGDQLQEGSYICYRTTAGLPGRIFVSTVDLENNLLDLEFVTWIVP